jgi:hypothetical protein
MVYPLVVLDQNAECALIPITSCHEPAEGMGAEYGRIPEGSSWLSDRPAPIVLTEFFDNKDENDSSMPRL